MWPLRNFFCSFHSFELKVLYSKQSYAFCFRFWRFLAGKDVTRLTTNSISTNNVTNTLFEGWWRHRNKCEFLFFPAIHRSIYLAIQRSTDPSIYRSIHLPIHRSTDPSIYPSIDLPIQRSKDPAIYRSIDLPIQRSTDPSIYPSIDLPIQRSKDLEIYR